jgi:hypothetical protein
MLHEVMSCAPGDSLGNYTKEKTIRSKRKVNATICEQLRGTTCWLKTECHDLSLIHENYDKSLSLTPNLATVCARIYLIHDWLCLELDQIHICIWKKFQVSTTVKPHMKTHKEKKSAYKTKSNAQVRCVCTYDKLLCTSFLIRWCHSIIIDHCS